MTIERLDHVSVVIGDLAAAIAFFTALGMTLEGEAPVEGPWVDRVNGLEGVRLDIVMMRTPDGHGRLELTKFRNPKPVEIEPAIAPPNALGLRSVMFTVESVDDTVARLRANRPNSSARWPVRGQVQTLLHARPRGHHRRAGRGTLRNSSKAFTAFAETGGALGAPSTRSHGSQPSCFLAYLRRGFVRRTKNARKVNGCRMD
jgi:catechol 2,3-dioxygenase-like lactoylglutathione lyase family enzyme